MIRRTLSEARSLLSSVAGLGGMAVTDERVTAAINYVQEVLMKEMNYPSLLERVRFCNYSRRIALPLEYETALRFNIQATPVPVANMWYEFSGYGPSRQDGDYGWTGIPIDRGESPLIRQADCTDTDGGQYLRVYHFSDERVSGVYPKIRILGKDQFGRVVRTFTGTSWIDGEEVQIGHASAAYNQSANKWSEITGIIKPRTNRDVELFWLDSDGDTHFAARYTHRDTVPRYRIYDCPGVIADDDFMSVHVLCRRRYRPAVDDNDLLYISDLQALRLGIMAERYEKSGDVDKALAHWRLATNALRADANAWFGDQMGAIEHSSPTSFGEDSNLW